jgi:hypothetical protein
MLAGVRGRNERSLHTRIQHNMEDLFIPIVLVSNRNAMTHYLWLSAIQLTFLLFIQVQEWILDTSSLLCVGTLLITLSTRNSHHRCVVFT